MRFLLGLFFLCHLHATSSAQTKTDSISSQYIKSYKDKFFLWPVLKQRLLTFELQNLNQVGNTVKFRPNNAFGLGWGMYVFDLAIEFTFAVPLNEEKESNFGTTSAQDLQLNILGRGWGADVYYQNYKGFYLTDPDSPIPASGAYPQRADFRTENFGATGSYAFNNKKFSLRSSYNFADRQLKSAGSFLIVGTYNSFSLAADSAILNNHYATRIGMTSQVKSLSYKTVSFAPGYSYNLIWNRIYVSGLVAVGPAVQWLGYDNDTDVHQSVTKVNTFASLRVAAGYSNDRFFTGVTFVSQVRSVVFENIQFSNSSTTYRILFGWRFKEFGFLKKSVFDLLPPWEKKKNKGVASGS